MAKLLRAIRVIPCLDIREGRVVKGIQFVGIRDAGDPLELARFYNDQGADELVFLDITASHEERVPVIELAKRVAEQLFIPFTVGGGIKSVQAVREALLAGADKVSLNTAALNNKPLIREAASDFGSQCVVVAIDARQISESGWSVFTHGGRNDTGISVVEWAQEAVYLGAGEILLTSMDQDGKRNGFDINLTRAVSTAVSVPVIASGGAGKPEHLSEAVIEGKADAVLVAGIVHDGVYTIKQLKNQMASSGLTVR